MRAEQRKQAEEKSFSVVQPISIKLDDLERVYLVGVEIKGRRRGSTRFSVQESLEELGRLATTAGLRVVGETFQMLNEPSSRLYIGSGKVAEIGAAVRALNVDTVIFDDELTPRQQRNIEKALGEGVRIADRTALILDIFSQRAATREGRLQVELAAAEYELPRVKKMWSHLERQSGAGNVKGMGETQKEIDKRLLRDKMSALKKELEGVRAHRQAYRKRRKAAEMPVVAIVGYTNAGKSTLINRISDAKVLAEDKLFATLDPTTRRMTLPLGKQILISDTVGFIQKLPTQLVAAFRATLEEIQEADVLLHVVDASHPDAGKQYDTVLKVLEEMGVDEDTPMVTAWNKVDNTDDPEAIEALAEPRANTVAVSALTGYGVDDLLVMIEAAMEESMLPFEALLPYARSGLVNFVREQGIVRQEEYLEHGIRLQASANLTTISRIEEFVTQFAPRERIFTWRREQVLRDLGEEEDEAEGGGAEAAQNDADDLLDETWARRPAGWEDDEEEEEEETRSGEGSAAVSFPGVPGSGEGRWSDDSGEEWDERDGSLGTSYESSGDEAAAGMLVERGALAGEAAQAESLHGPHAGAADGDASASTSPLVGDERSAHRDVQAQGAPVSLSAKALDRPAAGAGMGHSVT